MSTKVLLSVQVDPAFRLALRRLALERNSTVQALVTSALRPLVTAELSRLVPTDSRKVTLNEQKSFE